MVTPETRTELNRLLATAIANLNCGNKSKAERAAYDLNAMLQRALRN